MDRYLMEKEMTDKGEQVMKCKSCKSEYKEENGYKGGDGNFCSLECLVLNEPLPRKEVISVQPGDVLVLNLVAETDIDVQERLYDDLKRYMPNTEVLILSGGATLEVYREQEKEYCAVCTKSPCRCVEDQDKPCDDEVTE